MNHPSQKHFTQAEAHWDLERLYQDLAKMKGDTLTKMEKIHLCGLLCGYSPRDIAEKLHRSARGVEAFMCNTLYQYVKQLSNHDEERLRNHRDILQWLDELGYRKIITTASSSDFSLPWNGLIHLDGSTIHILSGSTIHVLNNLIHIEHFDPVKNKMVVRNTLRVEISCPSQNQQSKDASEEGEMKDSDSDSHND